MSYFFGLLEYIVVPTAVVLFAAMAGLGVWLILQRSPSNDDVETHEDREKTSVGASFEQD